MEESKKVLKARSCYGHLGGTLVDRLFARMLALGWLERDESKTTVYSLTEKGMGELTDLGVDIYEKR